MLDVFIKPTLLGESCHTGWAEHHSLKSLRVGELQIDWLRSEDLKEEKSVTAPILIIAVDAICRCQELETKRGPNGRAFGWFLLSPWRWYWCSTSFHGKTMAVLARRQGPGLIRLPVGPRFALI
jgi:hypothetical protein